MTQPDMDSAIEALHQFRSALRAGETARVEALLHHGQPVDSESDLFAALRAEAGLPAAVAQLRRFWEAAKEERYAVRSVADHELEVYERITAPTLEGPLRSVTLMRRGENGAWRVVGTSNALDDRPRLFVYGSASGPQLDDVALSRRCVAADGPFAEVFMDGAEGVLSHPQKAWVGSLRGPLPNSAQLTLPSLPDGFYEIAVEPDEGLGLRLEQLTWLCHVGIAAADAIGSTHVGVPGAERIIPRETLRHLLVRAPSEGGSRATTSLPAHRLATVWVKVHRQPGLAGEGYVATRGLVHFGLPELEVRFSECDSAALLEQLTTATVSALTAGQLPTAAGCEFSLLGVRCRLEPGRRGVLPGHSYGPYGARRLVVTGPEAN